MRRARQLALILVMFIASLVLLQTYRGVFGADFNDDEGSHLVSSLLILNVLRSILHGGLPNPVSAILEFHGHYPLVGIGHWPPLYYAVVAVWMEVTSSSRDAVLILSAVVAAGTATLLYSIVARRNGPVPAALAALAFAACPLVQAGTGELMLDLPVGLLCLTAMWVYRRYAASGRVAHAVLFGLIASAALLTKGTGACLALLPPFFVLLGRRWDLLRRPSFWLPAIIAGAVASPWYFATYRLTAPGFRYAWGLGYTQAAVAGNAAFLTASFGLLVPLIGFAAAGFVVIKGRRAPPDEMLAAAAALLLAVVAFQCIIPAALEPRYLIPALPPLLILTADAASSGWAFVQRRAGRGPALLCVLALVASMLPAVTDLPPALHLGMREAARQVWTHLPPGRPVVLVAAGAGVEPAAIAELALQDPARPSLFVVRGSRLLGGGGYNNSDYAPRYATLDDVQAAIDRYGITLVLLRSDIGAGEWAHVRDVGRLAAMHPETWQVVWRDNSSVAPTILYRVDSKAATPVSGEQLLALSAPRALADR